VNRWRGQVGLPPVATEAEAEQLMTRVDAEGGPAVRVLDMAGPQQRVLVAIVPGADKLFFFKMTAPPDVVEPRKAAFEQIVKTIRVE
jgi:hypothetical protein